MEDRHHKSNDYKLTAVQLYLKGEKTQTEICEIFNCSRRSLMRWVERYNESQTVDRVVRPNTPYKVNADHIKFVLDEIKKNKSITIQDLLNLLLLKFPDLTLSRVHLRQIIIDNNISLKLRRHRHEPIKRFNKDVDIKKMLKEFYDEVSKYNLDDIICIDETSISGLMKRNFCYEEVGKRCVITTKTQDVFKKYTVIFAINSKGTVAFEIYEKDGIDSKRLKSFLEDKVLKNQKKKLIILDNASSHRNDVIKDVIKKDNYLLYSVPYQHFTNAIENYFSVIKSKLKKIEKITIENMDKHIKDALKEIPKEQYKNIINGAYNR